MSAPLAARHQDGKPSELRVGYGAAGVEALQFSLANGVTSDTGFFKLFVSTTYVDMTVLRQQSPFTHATRGPAMKMPPGEGIWDAWTYPLTTRDSQANILAFTRAISD